MLSILVGHSYFLQFDQKQVDRAKPYPPLATLQVAARLRREGHDVALFDAMLADGVDDYEARLRKAQPQLALFYEDNYNFLTKMCLGKMRRAACEMIGRARRAGAQVVVAGSDATDAPETYLAAGAHVVLIGEGVSALSTLVDRLDANPQTPITELLDDVPGVASLARRRTTLPKVVSFPQPQHPEPAAWDLVDIERYRAIWRKAHGYFSLNMAASRGCSFRCTWCAKPIWGNTYMQRSADEVAAEMGYLKRTFGPDHIWFADDIFGFRVDWVSRFAEALQATQAAIPFTIQIRADLVSEKMAGVLRAAQCSEAWIGAESGSQRVLDAMNKGTRLEEIASARERLATEGIRVGFFIQLGYLGEDLHDILATRDLLERTRPDDIGVSVAYPLPGTRFFDLVKDQLRAKTHWQESNDLEMMFDGTYRSEFYRAIRNLMHDQISTSGLHSELSLQRRWEDLIATERGYRNELTGGSVPDHEAVTNDGR